MSLLSLIVPCYNEEQALPLFMEETLRVTSSLEGVSTEIIFINDGSRDKTLDMLRELAAQHKGLVRYISFSRNFGKEAAILAGLTEAKGDYAAVMDADLQDPPAMLPEMLHAIREEGYDCAGTRRVSRKGEPFIRSLFARAFYKLINMVSDTKLVDGARDYKLMTRPVREALVALPEYNRFSKGLYEWVGFRTKWFEFENVERCAGETKWSFWKLFRYSVEGIIAFTTAPLSVASFAGILFMLISVISMGALIARQIIYANSVGGWTSMMCAILFVSGVQLFCVGIMGQYMAKAYLEVKRRPNYIVAEREEA